MLLFRPTFITSIAFVTLICSVAQGSPQFGPTWFNVLDDAPPTPDSALVPEFAATGAVNDAGHYADAAATIATSSTPASASSSTTSSAIPSPVSTSTSGALHAHNLGTGGVHTALVLSAAASLFVLI